MDPIQEIDVKIDEVRKKMQTERRMLDAISAMRQATTNQDVLRQNQTREREAARSLAYFEETIRELQVRRQQLIEGAGSPRSAQVAPAGLPATPRNVRPGSQTSPQTPYDPRRSAYDVPPPGAPGPYPADGALTSAPKQYSSLDLIRAETPLTPAKISRMLHQLEFKLQVEKQYKAGIDKMAALYQADGDKKSRADAEAKRVESDRKIALLNTALKRYKALHVLDVVEEDEEDVNMNANTAGGQRKENMRNKPLSGKLQIAVQEARELEHAPVVNTGKTRSSSKKVIETYVTIKVEGTQHARTHNSRTDRWLEDFDIPVDKANEVEIAIYDKQVSEPNPVPIGMFWVRISDLVEAARRQRVLMETGGGQWFTAGAMPGSNTSYQMTPGGGNGDVTSPLYAGGMPEQQAAPGGRADGVDAWYAVEPAGALFLHLNFVKENVRKRAMDRPGGLGRQGAVRARKEEVHERNGHKFVQRQFYQIILCAFCSDFLLNAVGYQCEDCKYTCHKKCYEKVVTKCISKSNMGEDEEKLNHRIPHRFEPLTNIGANWCCHCGQMLPLGRKNARKCSECDITCHANCAHLVPDFCGMSMETANQLLLNWRDINRAKASAGSRPAPPKQPSHRQSESMSRLGEQQMSQMTQGMGAMQLPGGPGSPPGDMYQRPPMQGAPSMGPPPQDPRYAPYSPQAPPYSPPQTGASVPPRLPPGARPGPPPQAYDPSRPTMGYEPIPPPNELDGRGALGFDPSQQPALPPKPYPPPMSPPQQAQQPHRPGGQQRAPTLPQTPQSAPQMPPPKQLSQPSPAGPPIQMPPAVSASAAAAAAAPPARQKSKRKVGLDDFNFLAVLGKGNFGKVMLAEEKKTNGLYAIKVLKKEFIIENDEVESTRSEKRVFMAAARERHPFLIGLHSCFQTETRVYFVMEYVSGGDLMLHIQRKQFSVRQAKFYACEVLLALEYFHANGIVYRDLKLDNILLTLDGHIKVADYGLCKEEMWFGSTTSTFCGTPEFMAPEILLEQRYGRAVDWWAFGVLMYEMLLGQSPFRGDDEDEIFDAILEDEPLYPINMSRDAVAILQKLLTRDPNRRLGSTKVDAEEIKKQPFFKDVNWDDVFHKRIPPPYFPTINGTADTSNFDEEFTKEQPTLTPVHGQLSTRDQAQFNGFSWVAAWADI